MPPIKNASPMTTFESGQRQLPCSNCARISALTFQNRYKYQLALIVVVDRENHTQLAMQVLVLRERTEDVVFIFETFKELCGGGHPQVTRPFKFYVYTNSGRWHLEKTW